MHNTGQGELLIFAGIGFMAGLLMGITGAGGAVIAIPLFQLLLDSSLKEATVLSLVTVLLGTGVNLVDRMGEVRWKISLGLALSGSVANVLSMPLKQKIPEELIAFFLILIGLFSIWSVWRFSEDRRATSRAVRVHLGTVVLTGLLLGLVTTLTGLGGGVLLIPILLRVFNMGYEDALPTSLSSIFLISLSSLLIQQQNTLELLKANDFFFLAGGTLTAFTALRFLLRFLNGDQKLKLQRSVFTLATVLSLILIILKTV